MVQNVNWGNVGAVKHLLTTEMNSLLGSTLSALGPEIDNTNGPQIGQLALSLASAAFAAGNYVNVYFLPSNDLAGGSYKTLGTFSQESGALSNYLAATIYIKGTTAAQLEVFANVQLPAGKFKAFVATGGACPTLASSGNTLDLYPTQTQIG